MPAYYPPLVRVIFTLTPGQVATLNTIAAASATPRSQVLRHLLDAELPRMCKANKVKMAP